MAMIRRTIGTILCFLYGFAVPLFAVVTFALWTESRQELEVLKATAQQATERLGVPPELELEVIVPVIAVATLIFVWILAGRKTRRATWMIAGLNAFAIIFVGLIVIGQ